MPLLIACESVVNDQCQNPQYIEVTEEALLYLDSYTAFVEDFYWVGFNSVLGLFVAGLGVGLILKLVRKLK